ncbi:hypothetical protein BC830DRAFT_1164418 [Chytriomyces sp. MP71]|nr:hypothetical protein BC830DRAFT_1164418 [Chytriomyces sp. MP71]
MTANELSVDGAQHTRMHGWGRSGVLTDTGCSASALDPVARAAEITLFHTNGLLRVHSLAFGKEHGSAVASTLSEEGLLVTWGSNASGQLGRSKPPQTPARVDTLDLFTIIAVACGDAFTIALTSTGSVLSFGANSHNQLGHSFDKTSVTIPKKLRFIPSPHLVNTFPDHPPVVALACGARHSLVVTDDGSLWAFGDNSDGQLGSAVTHLSTSCGAILVKDLFGVAIVKVACGSTFSLALTASGTVYSWGSNSHGQLGHGTKTPTHTPTRITKLVDIVDISAGDSHAAALDAKGTCFVWGNGAQGQTASFAPWFLVPFELRGMDGYEFGAVAGVVCGRNHTVVMARRKPVVPVHGGASEIAEEKEEESDEVIKLYSFGANESGQLGLGNRQNRNSPSLIAFPEPLDIRSLHIVYAGRGDQMVLVSWEPDSLQVANKMLTSPSAVSGIGLSLAEVRTLVEDVEIRSSGAAAEMLRERLRRTISSLSHMNASFLGPESWLPSVSGDPSASIAEAREAFILIASMKHAIWAPLLHSILKNASFKAHSSTTSINGFRAPASPEYLRGLLLYLENPLLLSRKESRKGALDIAYILHGLSDTQKHVLENWWVHCPGLLQNFRRTVEMLNKALHYFTRKRLEEPTMIVLDVLKWLWAVNNLPFTSDDPLKFSHSEKTRAKELDANAAESEVPSDSAGARPTATFTSTNGIPTFNLQVDAASIPMTNGRPDMSHLMRMAAQALAAQVKTSLVGNGEFSFGDRPSPLPLIPHSCFINETLSRSVDVKNDFFSFYSGLRGTGAASGPFGASAVAGTGDNIFAFCKYPFVFTLGAKAVLLALDSQRQQTETTGLFMMEQLNRAFMRPTGEAAPRPRLENLFTVVPLRRKHLLQDAFKVIGGMAVKDLKKPLRVKFADELGVDGGGVSREFMDLFFRRLLKHSDMFEDVEGVGVVWFNPLSKRAPASFRIVGRVVGLSVFNGYLTNLPFPPVLFKRLLGWPANLDDLAVLQPQTARWLREMLAHRDAATFEEAYYGLEFSVTVRLRRDGNVALAEPYQNVNLPAGEFSGAPVTFANRADYVKAMVAWYTGGHVEEVLKEFRTGFLEVAGGPILDHFLPEQLETILRGRNRDAVDWKDLEKVCRYKEPYHRGHTVIKRFWSVFHVLPTEFKFKFLKFITGTDSIPPIKGLKEVQLAIQPSGGGAGPIIPQEREGMLNPPLEAASATASHAPSGEQLQTLNMVSVENPGSPWRMPRIPGIDSLLAGQASPFASLFPHGSASPSSIENFPAGTPTRSTRVVDIMAAALGSSSLQELRNSEQVSRQSSSTTRGSGGGVGTGSRGAALMSLLDVFGPQDVGLGSEDEASSADAPNLLSEDNHHARDQARAENAGRIRPVQARQQRPHATTEQVERSPSPDSDTGIEVSNPHLATVLEDPDAPDLMIDAFLGQSYNQHDESEMSDDSDFDVSEDDSTLFQDAHEHFVDSDDGDDEEGQGWQDVPAELEAYHDHDMDHNERNHTMVSDSEGESSERPHDDEESRQGLSEDQPPPGVQLPPGASPHDIIGAVTFNFGGSMPGTVAARTPTARAAEGESGIVADAPAARAATNNSVPIPPFAPDSVSEASRGTKRRREDEGTTEEVDDWEGHVHEEEMQTDVVEDIALSEDVKGKGPAHKKSRHGETAAAPNSDWTRSLVLDTSLNESVTGDADEMRLPVAHTCAYVLDLPAYSTVERLMERLVYAVENAGEFHLV